MSELSNLCNRLASSRQSIFLGRSVDAPSRLLFATYRDSVAVLGGTGTGKTSSVFIPSVAAHPGPVISTGLFRGGLDPDVRDATHHVRSELSTSNPGSATYEWHLEDGVPSLGPKYSWNYLRECTSWGHAVRISSSFLRAAIPLCTENRTYWVNLGTRVLAAALYYAAHVPGSTPQGFAAKLSSTKARNELFEAIHRDLGSKHEATLALGDFATNDATTARARASVHEVFESYVVSALLRIPRGEKSFTVADALSARSTTYVVISESQAKDVAPLIATFVNELRHHWTLKRGESAPLLLALDEVANVCPIEDLPTVMSYAGGSGTQLLVGFSNTSSARSVWGESGIDGLLLQANHLLILPGKGTNEPEFTQRLSNTLKKQLRVRSRYSVADNDHTAGRGAGIREIEAHIARDQASARLSALERFAGDFRARHTAASRELSQGRVPRIDIDQSVIREDTTEMLPVFEAYEITQLPTGFAFLKSGRNAGVVKTQGWWVDPYWSLLLKPD